MRLAGYVSRERCMSFLWLTWFLWHTEKCTFSQAFVPFKGCFEKVEEWLDDNKHLLGTIGMVILVVQVGVRNCSFLLCGFASVQFILPPVFFLLCVSSHLFVSGCLATSKKKKKKKEVCIQWPLCHHHLQYMRPVFSGLSGHPHTWNITWNVEVTVFCTLILSERITATWLCAKRAAVMYKEPLEERRAEILNIVECRVAD